MAAKATFAERGFYGARINDITAASGVNVRIIYHFFGSKEKLYYEIIREVARKLAESAPLLAEDVKIVAWEAAASWSRAKEALSDQHLDAICLKKSGASTLPEFMLAGSTFASLMTSLPTEECAN